MAIAFVGATDGGNNSGTGALTFSHTVGAGSNRLLIVAVAGDVAGGADDITGVTFDGVAMTLAAKRATSLDINNRFLYLYYLLNPNSGAHNVVVSSTANHYLLAGAADYTGVKQSAQPDATTTSAGSGAINNWTTGITTANDNSWAILVENGYNSNAAPTGGTGATVRTADAAFGTFGIFDSNGAITPAGSYNMTTNRPGNSSTILHVVASFQPDTGGGGFQPAWARNSNTVISSGARAA